MDDESRDVSLRLSRILERVGVSERMRQLRRDANIKEEIQDTIIHNIVGSSWSFYTFGSSIESTMTPDMHTDIDKVGCNETYPVIDHIEQAPLGKQSLLAVSDYETKPGYVKLQVVCACCRAPRTIYNSCISNYHRVGYDHVGRICYKHEDILQDILPDVQMERNGPACTTFHHDGCSENDNVYAVRSRSFPHIAVEPLLECTKTGWLSIDDVEEMIQYGCLYVGVGHPSSNEKEYEWRISFSQQERKLMFKLNQTQHQCYVLLKIIKNMLTSKPDIGKSITSYHCKTCLFRVISKTRADKWTQENLIPCTFDCLNELLRCLRNGACPNFFIKTNNMFERRVYGEVKERLVHHLSAMLNEEYALFYRIRSDNIGVALRGLVNRYINIDKSRLLAMLGIYINACRSQGYFILVIAEKLKSYTNEETRRYLFKQLCYLSSVCTITEHTQDETSAAIRDLEPILQILCAANFASLAFSTDLHESKHRLLQISAYHLKQSMPRDLLSGRLLYGTILYRQGNIDACCNLLEQLEQNLHEAVQSMCGCCANHYHDNIRDTIHILYHNPDPQTMLKSSAALCTVFLPSHTEIIPTALQYELYRSIATPPGSRNDLDDVWFDLAVVDSKVYMYFLQYLVYFRLNRPAARRHAIDNLLKQLWQDNNLGHRETGYNLLGWINSQEGQIEAACYCFLQSWTIRPQHNAAKWHMLNLISRHYVARQ